MVVGVKHLRVKVLLPGFLGMNKKDFRITTGDKFILAVGYMFSNWANGFFYQFIYFKL